MRATPPDQRSVALPHLFTTVEGEQLDKLRWRMGSRRGVAFETKVNASAIGRELRGKRGGQVARIESLRSSGIIGK